MKMFYIPGLGRRSAAPADAETMAEWSRDPLSHPALSNMSPRELADLPLGRRLATARNGDAAPRAC